MKKVYSLLLALSAFATPVAASAETLTLFGEATDKSNTLPFNVYFSSDAIHSQMIYPEDMLTEMKGQVIDKVSFTLVQTHTMWKSSGITLKMGTTEQASYSDVTYIDNGLTTVATVAVEGLDTNTPVPYTWEIALDAPYTYTGGNLVLDFTNVRGTGNGRNWYFQGQNQDVATGLSRTSTVNFLPTITFDYAAAAEESATVSAESIKFPIHFVGDEAVSSVVKLTNTGTTSLSGTIALRGEGFSVSPKSFEGMAADSVLDITVTFATNTGGLVADTLDIAVEGLEGNFAIALNAWGVEAPDAFRCIFNEKTYKTEVPEFWSVFAEEYVTETGEFSDATTNYADFGDNLVFESKVIEGYDALLWNHANPMPFSDIYTRYYYVVSPKLGGDFVLGAIMNEVAATGASVKAFNASLNKDTNMFSVGEEIEITWDTTPSQEAWSTGKGTAEDGAYVALLMKYAAVSFFASDKVENSISNIITDSNAKVEYYNLQGIKVQNPANGIFIRRQGNSTTKVVL